MSGYELFECPSYSFISTTNFTKSVGKLGTLYSIIIRGRNAHISARSPLKSTGKSIKCTHVSQSTDNDLVD